MKVNIVHAALVALFVTGTAFGASTANATTLYNNLSATSVDADLAHTYSGLYDSFSTGTAAVTFDSLKVLLEADEPSDSYYFTLALLSDDSGAPGSVISILATQQDSTLSSSLSEVSLTPSIGLAANKRYWIGLSSPGTVRWSWSSDTSGVGVAGEYLATGTGGVAPNSTGPYQMKVDASLSATPLPAALPLFAAGIFGLGLLGWRKKRKATAFAA